MFKINTQKEIMNYYLDTLFNKAPVIELKPYDKIVIFSDLHVGGRGRRDDFLPNSKMFMYLLKNYYLHNNYTLVLNGDVEELQRLSHAGIKEKWKDLFELFEKYEQKAGFYKLTGNHDSELYLEQHTDINKNLLDALRLKWNNNSIFIFHGHQPSPFYKITPKFTKYLLRYIAHPLAIRNFTRSYDNKRMHRTEKFIYEYSKERKIISIIGHTHRPLFESLSEIDLLKFKIEQLIRIYPDTPSWKKILIEEEISRYKQEIETIYSENHEYGFRSSLYNQELTIPSIFNSGSVIGRRGLTAIELSGGNISLVHWFDRSSNKKNYSYREELIKQLRKSSYFKMVLKSDSLDYVFSRIKLLS